MKRKMMFCAAAILVMVATGFSSLAAERTYLALGDSISTGYVPGGSHLEEKCFTNILASNHGYDLINEAVDGFTTQDIYEKIAGGSLDEEIERADLITITAGGNDLLSGIYTRIGEVSVQLLQENENSPESVDTMQRMATFLQLVQELALYAQSEELDDTIDQTIVNLKEIVAYLQERNDDVTIIIATQYQPYQWMGDANGLSIVEPVDLGISKLNKEIQSELNGAGETYLVADVYTEFSKSEEDLCNASWNPFSIDFHPNEKGHEVIAGTFQNILNESILHES